MHQKWIGSLSDVVPIIVFIILGVLLSGLVWVIIKKDRSELHGTAIVTPLIIVVAVLSVFYTGYKAPQALVGDEVTHFFMLKKQADDLSLPNFLAHIPVGGGITEVRRYPHSFVWHYFGAVIYYLSGRQFIAVQLYQAIYFAQLLVVAYLLARSRGGVRTRAALLYVTLLATLPVCLVLSVTFYQDIPMAAQALTAFYLLDRRKWLASTFFMAFALGLKITAMLFFPVFFMLLAYRLVQFEGARKGALTFICALIFMLGFILGLGKTIKVFGDAEFYPEEKLKTAVSIVKNRAAELLPDRKKIEPTKIPHPKQPSSHKMKKTTETAPVVIANHPGDLRVKKNFLIYGGGVLWFVLLGALCSLFLSETGLGEMTISKDESTIGLWLTGGSYILLTAWLSRTAPDARFFIPGLIFILLPLTERFVKLPWQKPLISLVVSISLVQGGLVLAKTYKTRTITPATRAVISYLSDNLPTPQRVFMYPEGSYRFFPVEHNWYLGYRLRDFWRSDNDARIEMLHHFGIGAIVIKKYLISEVDENITDLGVYPVEFVEEIHHDSRFILEYENPEYIIYRTPEYRTPEAIQSP